MNIEAPIQTKVEVEETTNLPPEVIVIEFSEIDRITAKPYSDNHECMFCTALRNRGINVKGAGGMFVRTEFGDYNVYHENTKAENGFNIFNYREQAAEIADIGPFWKPSIVGQKAILHRINNE